jgi:hypothetical protein
MLTPPGTAPAPSWATELPFATHAFRVEWRAACDVPAPRIVAAAATDPAALPVSGTTITTTTLTTTSAAGSVVASRRAFDGTLLAPDVGRRLCRMMRAGALERRLVVIAGGGGASGGDEEMREHVRGRWREGFLDGL